MRLRLLLLLVMVHAEASEWERIAPLPEPNAGFLCGTLGGEIVVAGGTNWEGGGKRWLQAVHVYSPAADAWRTATPLDAPCAYAAFGVSDTKLMFAGGSSGEATHARLCTLSLHAPAALELPRGTVYSAGAVIGHELFVAGGAPAQDQLAALSTAGSATDLDTGRVRGLASMPGPGFGMAASAACGGMLYVFGGARWDDEAGEARNLSTGYVYDPGTNAWQPLPALPRATRGLCAVALDDHRILIAGGYAEEAFTDEAFVFDTKSPGYVRSISLPYPALVALVICGEHLYCLGGEDEKKHRTAACYRIPLKAFAR